MSLKRKKPSAEENEPSNLLIPPEKRIKTKDVDSLSEAMGKMMKAQDFISTSGREVRLKQLKQKKPSSSSSPSEERKERSGRITNERSLVWSRILSHRDVLFGIIEIPVRSAGALYSNAEEKHRGTPNTRLARVEDDEGRTWKMEVELRRDKLFLHCDLNFMKQHGLQRKDMILLYTDSHSRYYINCLQAPRKDWKE